MKTQIKVPGDKVAIIPSDAIKKTDSGIVLSDKTGKPQSGEVIAVGKGNGEPMTAEVGNTVYYPDGVGVKITHDGLDILVMHEDQIIVIV